MAKHQCVNCRRWHPGWATYTVPNGNGFTFPRTGKKIKAGEKVCGACVVHAQDAGAIKPQLYNRIAKNQMEEG